MDGLFGIIVALIVAALTIAGKAQEAKRSGGKRPTRPQWPGPIAGGPTMPTFPRPVVRPSVPPTPPTPPSPPQQKRRPGQPRPSPAPPDFRKGTALPGQPYAGAGGEGIGSEGIGSEGIGMEGFDTLEEGTGTEGPRPGENVGAELSRFNTEIDRDIDVDRNLANVPVDIRQLEPTPTRLGGSLAQEADLSAARVTSGEGVSAFDMDAALASQYAQAQAIVLAEVLGKPKALRCGGYGRR